MMYLITGQPGNGKTLYAISTIEARRQEEHRPVYYFGIPELTLEWTLIEKGEDWYKLPEGAIIVIDECQKVFPPRPSASKPPVHVSEFETHRHKGFDVYLMTQHPSLVDNHLKRLAGKHLHVIRSFGMQRADVFEMQSVMDPTAKNLKSALRKEFKFPKEVYAWYKSSELHTHKRKLPWQYYAIPTALVVIGLFVWASFHILGGMAKTGATSATKAVPDAIQQTSQGAIASNNGQSHVKTTAEYVAQFNPRVEGLAYTAPVYDAVTVPDEAPLPVACVDSKSKGCKCYSQQATRLAMPQDLCKQIVANGFFQSFTPKSQAQLANVQREQGGSVVPKHEAPSESPANGASGATGASTLSWAAPAQGNESTNPRYNVALRGQ